MKIALFYSLLIYQLLQHCDAAGNGSGYKICYLIGHILSFTVTCRPLKVVMDAAIEDIRVLPAGSNISFYSHVNDHGHTNNDSYILLHQNHQTKKLEVVSQQQDNKFTISDLQVNSSGVYCAYRQRIPKDKEQCCIKISG